MTVLVLTYFLFCFTNFVPEPETRNELGSFYNYVTFSNIGVHVSIMARGSYLAARLSCKKKLHARKLKKA